MQFNHHPGVASILLRIVQGAEVALQRRIDAQALTLEPDDLRSVEVEDSDFDAWLQAGGDLLMGNDR